MLGPHFKAYLELERNYSPHTVAAYVRDLDAFCEYMRDVYEFDPSDPKEVDAVTHRMIRGWMAEMMDHGLSRRTVARKIASLNGWFSWLQKTGRVEENPAKKVSVPKYDKKLPAFLKQDSVEKLFEKIEYPDDFEGARDRALLEVLYSCGLRRSELISLKIKDVHFEAQTLKVMGKGRKERIVPFGDAAKQAMGIYLHAAKDAGVNVETHFFVKKDGKALYPKLVHRVVEHYLRQACTLSKNSPHVLRHSFATHLLNRGADLNAIKELLGHNSLAATQVYLHNSIQQLKDVYDQAHPKA